MCNILSPRPGFDTTSSPSQLSRSRQLRAEDAKQLERDDSSFPGEKQKQTKRHSLRDIIARYNQCSAANVGSELYRKPSVASSDVAMVAVVGAKLKEPR